MLGAADRVSYYKKYCCVTVMPLRDIYRTYSTQHFLKTFTRMFQLPSSKATLGNDGNDKKEKGKLSASIMCNICKESNFNDQFKAVRTCYTIPKNSSATL